MKYNPHLEEEIKETAYLTAENAFRYRPIMRFFYEKYEQAENWLYKEDVHQALKEHQKEYTLEECARDLDFLVSKKSLTTMQDTENANTLEKFKFKNFRYQMTDYAIEIERMTIRLEEMEVKVTSLESRLFERIKTHLTKLMDITSKNENELYEIWADLTTDFTNLNQSYQDFLKKFNEPETEELLQSTLFIEFKNDLIHYLENFIKEYIRYSKEIQDILKEITEENVNIFMDSLVEHHKKAPKVRPNFDFNHLKEINKGRYTSIKKWFYNESGMSEGERLLKATTNIISKITKYASNLIELHGNMIQRKEDYKKLAKLFDKEETLKDAHTLASTVLGVNIIRHFKGISNVLSDSIVNSYEVEPIEIEIDPMKRGMKIIHQRTPIKDNSKEKQKILEEAEHKEAENRKILENFISKKTWIMNEKVSLTKEERRYLFSLIDKIEDIENNVGYGTDPLFGMKYLITFDEKAKCTMESEDGTLYMEGIKLEFIGDKNE